MRLGGIKMYRNPTEQMTLDNFKLPFGGKLDSKNRWVKLVDLIPWDTVEVQYAENFSKENGPTAKPARMAFGAIIIQKRLGTTDQETLDQITENPYLQYFIGLKEFQTEPPFDVSLMTYFRKRISSDSIKEINEQTIKRNDKKKDKDNDDQPPKNKGKLIMDATCAPADIKYPTDLSLLNECREKLDQIIDHQQAPRKGEKARPRTYRNKGKKDYLKTAKAKKISKKNLRKAIRKQLNYVRRNLMAVETLVKQPKTQPLTEKQQKQLEIINQCYTQQKTMYDNKTHSIENRIVSISQPHVRPIVRGKTAAPVEFGAKISMSLHNGYTRLERVSWDNFNESTDLISAVEEYKKRNGYYPECVIVDKLYRNRNNIAWCKERNIRISGPALGRPKRTIEKAIKNIEKLDSAIRNSVEGKFGEAKRCYGLNRIMTKLKETSETSIGLSFYVMNLEHMLRVLLCPILQITLKRLFLRNWGNPALDCA